jgi:hypothetical protein
MQRRTTMIRPQATRRASRHLETGVVLTAAGSKNQFRPASMVLIVTIVIRNLMQLAENKASTQILIESFYGGFSGRPQSEIMPFSIRRKISNRQLRARLEKTPIPQKTKVERDF